MIKLKVILLPIKFEQRENPRPPKKKKILWEGHHGTCALTQQPRHPKAESLMRALVTRVSAFHLRTTTYCLPSTFSSGSLCARWAVEGSFQSQAHFLRLPSPKELGKLMHGGWRTHGEHVKNDLQCTYSGVGNTGTRLKIRIAREVRKSHCTSRPGRGRGEPGAWRPKGPQCQVLSLPLPRLPKISTFGVSLGPSLMVPRLPRTKNGNNRFCSPDWACFKDLAREACHHSKPRLVCLSWWSIRGSHTSASHVSWPNPQS